MTKSVDRVTARQWEIANGPQFISNLHESNMAMRMLTNVCEAAAATLNFATTWNLAEPKEILNQYPSVLKQCDTLDFDEMAQAIAYLILHLPDRYCRVFQVLERLLVLGMLPLGNEGGFSAVDIGAGPGPGIFAVRNFYAALSDYASTSHDVRISPLTTLAIVERSTGMGQAMHHFARHLVLLEQGYQDSDFLTPISPSPYAATLARSATPFGASHSDFSNLDLRADHARERLRMAHDLVDDFDITWAGARRLAQGMPINVPSAYALAIMTNFLTTTDAVPRFERALSRLMQSSLVPGGLLVVLGGVGAHYPAIYNQLDELAAGFGLHVMDGFEQPLQAGFRFDERQMLAGFVRSTWQTLAANIEDVSELRSRLADMNAHDIYDSSIVFNLPKFRARVYRRGRWPRLRRSDTVHARKATH